ncbi:hypothetical protein DPEC_G00301760 [Dallia pectoralis]|uniref:Uncharacterized protein n=1 Tax=Dallia pectoralis TaxID=75939 RepID=A0ACC2FH31_DALPE|nr:hypothetical protein DPEC_G00301760 [Dallia pectoralis]
MSHKAIISKRYLYTSVEGSTTDGEETLFYVDEGGGSLCEPMPQLVCMTAVGEEGGANVVPELGLVSEGIDTSQDQPQPASPSSPNEDRKQLHEDVEMTGSGYGSGTESHGNESHSNKSHGNMSMGSSNGDCSSAKDSGLLESSGSNKSSELSSKAKTKKELCKTLKELKVHPLSDKRCKGKASTLNTLKYALRCVKPVKANEEYYQMLMVHNSQPPGMKIYTIEEINSITSEHTNQNKDTFAVAVSLITGKIVYISDRASTILHCPLDRFSNAKFVEFLTAQDVSVFYSFTASYRLPSWSMCTGTESSPTECMQEKSFFCRISGCKDRGSNLQYHPFRLTPYLIRVQTTELSEEQFCCLLLAERVHCGYDAPRIPPVNRVFTTTHTPSCLFQEVDERAVPLLGYLPQDLIGTPLLLHLHPSDRPLMLAVHRKILQCVGQPFDHPIRFCARNGEYITIDTSWSSFVNPWSRKVSFVIGRHKVRTGPVNKDMFAVPAFTNGKPMDSDIQEITEQIHRMLLQPVHNTGSGGYGRHGSNGSYDPLRSVTSHRGSNSHGSVVEEPGKSQPRTFQEICKEVQMIKSHKQQVYQPSSSQSGTTRISESGAHRQKSLAAHMKESDALESDAVNDSVEELLCKDQTVNLYQQISCLDGVVRYLESCKIPIRVKRTYQFSSDTTSSNSDEDQKGPESGVQVLQDPGQSLKALTKPLFGAAPVVGGPISPLARPNKAESITSQCSYSSTIVHVGDKKPQPESGIIEDVADGPAPSLLPISVVSPPSQEREAYKRLGLTKQVLAAHTQKEEQDFLIRCKDLKNARIFQKHCSTDPYRPRAPSNPLDATGPQGVSPETGSRPETSPAAVMKGRRNRKSKKPRMKRPDSSDSAITHHKPLPALQDLNHTSCPPSEASQAFPVPYPAIVSDYPFPVYPVASTAHAPPTCPDSSLTTGFGDGQSSPSPPTAVPYPASLITPVVALVVPDYLFPQERPIGQIAASPRPSFYPEQPVCQPLPSNTTQQPLQTAYTIQQPHQTAYNTQQPLQTAYTTQQPLQPAYTTRQPLQPAYTTQQPLQPAYTTQQPLQPAYTTQQPLQTAYTTQQPLQPAYTTQQPLQTAYTTQQTFPAQTAYDALSVFPSQPSFPVQAQFVPHVSYPNQAFPFCLPSESPVMDPREGTVSHCFTSASTGQEPASSSPLFESRCSSPLQLNLLQLDDNRSVVTPPPSGAPGSSTAAVKSLSAQSEENLLQVECPDDAHSDDRSSATDLLDMVLHDETNSTSGSDSGSGSRSPGSGTSSGGWRNGRSNTGKHFGIVNSLEDETKATVIGKNRFASI